MKKTKKRNKQDATVINVRAAKKQAIKKRRNAQDTTLINNRARAKEIKALEEMLDYFDQHLLDLAQRVAKLEKAQTQECSSKPVIRFVAAKRKRGKK